MRILALLPAGTKMMKSSYLYHHGIKGQKWGVRRFQNKDGSLTSAGKNRYKQSHRDKLVEKYKNKGMSQKDAEKAADKRRAIERKIAIGAAITAGALATYGLYRYTKRDRLDANVFLDSQLKRKTFESSDFDTQINDDLKKINREGWAGHLLLSGRQSNCTSCSMAYEMRRRGYDVVADKTKNGRMNEDVEKFFQSGAKFKNGYSGFYNPSLDKMIAFEQTLKSQGEGARGMIHGQFVHGGGHSIAYEVHNGKVHFVDGQIGRQYKNMEEAIGNMRAVDYLRTDNLALANSAAETVRNNTTASLLSERPSQFAVQTTLATAGAVMIYAPDINKTAATTKKKAKSTKRSGHS